MSPIAADLTYGASSSNTTSILATSLELTLIALKEAQSEIVRLSSDLQRTSTRLAKYEAGVSAPIVNTLSQTIIFALLICIPLTAALTMSKVWRENSKVEREIKKSKGLRWRKEEIEEAVDKCLKERQQQGPRADREPSLM